MTSTARRAHPTAVFLGPSLPRDDAAAIVDADFYPPARKGDVYRILASGVETIVLIDGVFHNTPSVWQRELLNAMEEGIRVLGASSMGALRAAELLDFGMIGCGTVFEWYRDGVIDGDDEVALWHAPEELGFRPLSEPLVNIRYALGRAVDDRCLEGERAEELIAYAKALYYPERSFPKILEHAARTGWPAKTVAALKGFLSSEQTNIKTLDALRVLRQCARMGPRPTTGRRRESSLGARDTWWEQERLLLTGFMGERAASGAEVLAMARRDPSLAKAMRESLSRRRFLLEWAMQNDVTCPPAFRRAFLKRWERRHGAGDRSLWLGANGLTGSGYHALVADRALVDWLTTKGPGHFGLRSGFVLAWARQNGVATPRAGRTSPRGRERWIVEKGPAYFGLDWSFDTAFLQELQVTGRASDLVAAREER